MGFLSPISLVRTQPAGRVVQKKIEVLSQEGGGIVFAVSSQGYFVCGPRIGLFFFWFPFAFFFLFRDGGLRGLLDRSMKRLVQEMEEWQTKRKKKKERVHSNQQSRPPPRYGPSARWNTLPLAICFVFPPFVNLPTYRASSVQQQDVSFGSREMKSSFSLSLMSTFLVSTA